MRNFRLMPDDFSTLRARSAHIRSQDLLGTSRTKEGERSVETKSAQRRSRRYENLLNFLQTTASRYYLSTTRESVKHNDYSLCLTISIINDCVPIS